MMGPHRESSSSSGSLTRQLAGPGKHMHFTEEQVKVLEQVYGEYPNPSLKCCQKLILDYPIFCSIDPKLIKLWFGNRRCREQQYEEFSSVSALEALYKLVLEEKDRLQEEVQKLASALTDGDATNTAGLLSIAEETMTVFFSKATEAAANWVVIPEMKSGPDSLCTFAVSHSSSGVAARACALVNLQPMKIAAILKDRPSWFRDCRSVEVFSMVPAGNGATAEILCTQMYAPNTFVSPRDFWTLRYTTCLRNGSVLVCETSLPGIGDGSNAVASNCVRAEMLPSGYLIRPCEGGASIIYIVYHLNLETLCVPEVLRSLYQSSEVGARKMTMAALSIVRQIAQESSGEVINGLGREPAVLRTFSQRLSRGFHDAVNGSYIDSWSALNLDGSVDVIVAVNSTKSLVATSGHSNSPPTLGGVLCAKTSLLLQDVHPAVLVRFLREHRSEWADVNLDALSAAALKVGPFAYPGLRNTTFTGSQNITQLGYTIEQEEILEIIQLEAYSVAQGDASVSTDIHLLQISSEIDDNAGGICSELVFSPIDKMFPDDGILLPSGFRVMLCKSKSDAWSAQNTLDPSSGLEVGSTSADVSSTYDVQSVLTIAFQLPFENGMQDHVAAMAYQYVRNVIDYVHRVAIPASPCWLITNLRPKPSPACPQAVTLAHYIFHSYSLQLGTDLFAFEYAGSNALLENFWRHPDAILCCSLEANHFIVFVNQAGLNMLETTPEVLQDITLDKFFDELDWWRLKCDFPRIMEQGFVCLPYGLCKSTMGRPVSYDRAVSWRVFAAEDCAVHYLAFSFVNWSFIEPGIVEDLKELL